MAPKRPRDTFQAPAPASSSTARATEEALRTSGKRVKVTRDGGASEPSAGRPGAKRKGGAAAGDGEDEGDLDLDIADGPAQRREVLTAGYDSDSSAGSDEGGFGGTGGGRAGAKEGDGKGKGKGKAGDADKMDEDDDNDMFAGADAGGAKGKGDEADKKKKKDFLELGDIEGQEFAARDASDAEDDEDEYLSEDDRANDDEAPRGKRDKKGMGYKLSSFNMKEELAEGRFDSDGNYVRNDVDPHANYDKWLDGVSKAEMRAAAEAKRRADDEARARQDADDALDADARTRSRDDSLIGIVTLLRERETVAGGLARLDKMRQKAKRHMTANSDKKKRQQKGAKESTGKGKEKSTAVTSAVDKLSANIELLTQLSSALLSIHGELEIYEQSREQIIQDLKSEGAVRRDWAPPTTDGEEELEQAIEQEIAEAAMDQEEDEEGNRRTGRRVVKIARPAGNGVAASSAAASSAADGRKFMYKWRETPADQEADKEYGPYGMQELAQWTGAGYFGANGEAIWVKPTADASTWQAWTDLQQQQ